MASSSHSPPPLQQQVSLPRLQRDPRDLPGLPKPGLGLGLRREPCVANPHLLWVRGTARGWKARFRGTGGDVGQGRNRLVKCHGKLSSAGDTADAPQHPTVSCIPIQLSPAASRSTLHPNTAQPRSIPQHPASRHSSALQHPAAPCILQHPTQVR